MNPRAAHLRHHPDRRHRESNVELLRAPRLLSHDGGLGAGLASRGLRRAVKCQPPLPPCLWHQEGADDKREDIRLGIAAASGDAAAAGPDRAHGPVLRKRRPYLSLLFGTGG